MKEVEIDLKDGNVILYCPDGTELAIYVRDGVVFIEMEGTVALTPQAENIMCVRSIKPAS